MVRRGHSTLNLRLRDVYFINLRLIKPEYGAKFFPLQPDEKLQVCQKFLTFTPPISRLIGFQRPPVARNF